MLQETIEELLARFLKSGGKIDKYYLRRDKQTKQTLVHLNGWFSGKNIREAITKAFAGK
ncbi:MAG: hypothetical protein HYS86_01245 [Candidatus Chisholmbacteria bacterium]|nr:hypothetical protein [Candidatus Chisholmbacteria bacterium]